MLGAYGSGLNRPHTEDELAKAKQALALLKAHRERGETAAQRIGSYIAGANPENKYKKVASTVYDGKSGFGSKATNGNYRKVFKPSEEIEEEEEKYTGGEAYQPPSKSRLEKINSKYNNGGFISNEPKSMSNLANLGKKALNPVNEMLPTQPPVANEFGVRPQIKNPVKKPEPTKPRNLPPRSNPAKQNHAPPPPPAYSDPADDDRPIKPAKHAPALAAEDENIVMEQCRYCERKFNTESLSKHEGVCLERPDRGKRKVFDSKKVRIVSEEQKKFMAQGAKKEPKAPKKMPKWKQQSAQFRNAMKATGGADGKSSGPKEYEGEPEDSGLLKCPTCGRTFNEEAGKRHMPFCANKAKLDALKNPKGKPAAKGGRKK